MVGILGKEVKMFNLEKKLISWLEKLAKLPILKSLQRRVEIQMENSEVVLIKVNGKKIDPKSKQAKQLLKEMEKMSKELEKMGRELDNMFK